MEVFLYRHGATAGNLQKRYIGRTDEPLCPEGIAALRRADFSPDGVFVSPLLRARQTASILFPDARQTVVADLREMDFGLFENQNYRELAGNADYAAWLETNCEGPCPGGESMTGFCERTCRAFEALVDGALSREEKRLVIVAHGGTVMALASRFAVPRRGYFDWHVQCGAARRFTLAKANWHTGRSMALIG